MKCFYEFESYLEQKSFAVFTFKNIGNKYNINNSNI